MNNFPIMLLIALFFTTMQVEARKHREKKEDKKQTHHRSEKKKPKIEIHTDDDVSGAELTVEDIDAMDQEMLELYNNPQDRKVMKPEVRARLDAGLKELKEDEELPGNEQGEIIIPTADELSVEDVNTMTKEILQAYSQQETEEMKPQVKKAFWARVKATGAVIE